MKRAIFTSILLFVLPGCWGFNATGKQEANLRKDETSGVYTFDNRTKGGQVTALAAAQADSVRMRAMAELERAKGEVAIKKAEAAQKEVDDWKTYFIYSCVGAASAIVLALIAAHKLGVLNIEHKEALRAGNFFSQSAK